MSFLDIKKIFLQEVTIYLLSKYGDKVYFLKLRPTNKSLVQVQVTHVPIGYKSSGT